MLIADRCCSQHADAMGRDPAERTAPDLFTTATASALPATEEAAKSEPRRYVLPKNLRNAVKHLSDGELDLMHAATLEELKDARASYAVWDHGEFILRKAHYPVETTIAKLKLLGFKETVEQELAATLRTGGS
jgi:hypothetical protein